MAIAKIQQAQYVLYFGLFTSTDSPNNEFLMMKRTLLKYHKQLDSSHSVFINHELTLLCAVFTSTVSPNNEFFMMKRTLLKYHKQLDSNHSVFINHELIFFYIAQSLSRTHNLCAKFSDNRKITELVKFRSADEMQLLLVVKLFDILIIKNFSTIKTHFQIMKMGYLIYNIPKVFFSMSPYEENDVN